MVETLGEYLKRIRKDNRLTLREVEDKTKISNAYLSQVENGKIAKPSPSVLYKLAECYGIAYEVLMKSAGYPVISSHGKTVVSRRPTSLEKITEEEEKELLEYLEFLRNRRLRK
jgi:transcriptional regulator with XRE-family HTH domain